MSHLLDSSIPKAVEISTPAGSLCGLRWGTPGSSRILALHGWLDNAASFSVLAPLLDNSEIVALDLPGHGYSGYRSVGEQYHFIDYISTVLAAIKGLGWQRCYLLGHSLGAGIASFTAAADPDRICGLFLIDGLGPHSEKADNAATRLRKSIRKSANVSKSSLTTYASIETMIEARCRVGSINIGGARLLVERNVMKVENGFCWRTDPRLLDPSPQYMTEEQVRSILGAITVPTLLGLASNGPLKTRPETAGRIDAFGEIEVLEFHGDHHFHLDDPQPLAQQINRFLAMSEANLANATLC